MRKSNYEMDYIIATRINGWILTNNQWHRVTEPDARGYESITYQIDQPLYNPTEDIAQAMDMVNKYIGSKYNLQIAKKADNDYCVTIFGDGKDYSQSGNYSLSFAVCEVVLKHSGILLNTSMEPIGERCQCPL